MLIFRNSLFGSKTVCLLTLQFSKRKEWRDVFFSRSDSIICVKPFTTSVANLGKYHPDTEWTDKNFSDRLIKSLKEPKILFIGFCNLIKEFGKLYEEVKESSILNSKHTNYQDPDNAIDMLFTFDKKEDFERFMVFTDSEHCRGYTSASLKMTPAKTALFSGNVCTDLVKDGEAKFAGYASMITRKALRSFKRIKCFNWTKYTHLVLKVRGDGRTYYANFSVKVDFESDQSWVYSYPLFTRGGPYWQVTKIPFSNFVFISKGKTGDIQPRKISLHDIITLSVTVKKIDGPFQLEIDYIGLELDIYHRQISPYETYGS